MGFNSSFKVLKRLKKTPVNGRLNNLNDPVLNVLRTSVHEMLGRANNGTNCVQRPQLTIY